MARRYCPVCRIAYPAAIDYKALNECRVCEGDLTYEIHLDPDPDWETREQVARELRDLSHPQGERRMSWRYEYLRRLGYGCPATCRHPEGEFETGGRSAVGMVLAESHVDLHVLEDLLRRGASLDEAARVLI